MTIDRQRLAEVTRLALWLGLTAFGGPAAHIALLHDEAVTRRRWLDEERFLDLLGATNLIPGPNSTEMVIHLGYLRAGWAGLVAAGLGFVTPAMAIVLACAWAYVRFGATPAAAGVLAGVTPVVVAIVVKALWDLGRRAVRGTLTAGVGLAVLALALAGVGALGLLAAAGVVVMLVANGRRLLAASRAAVLAPPVFLAVLAPAAAQAFSPTLLFFLFLRIGAVLYGSGYVLLAFLRQDFVVRLGWLSDQQLLDAVAVGQVTPGPLFTTATFIGYLLGGVPAALLATLGIFLPSFVFVALSGPLIPRLRRSPWAAALLDGVNVASLGLMAAVTWQLAASALADPASLVVLAVAALLLVRFRVSATWLVAGGAALGLLEALVA